MYIYLFHPAVMFIILGVLVGGASTIRGIVDMIHHVDRAWLGVVIGLVITIVWPIIGCYLGKDLFPRIKKTLKARRDGRRYNALLWELGKHISSDQGDSDGYALVVRFFDEQGRMRQEKLITYVRDRNRFPIHAAVEVAEYEDELFLLSDRAKALPIDRKAELLNPDAEVINLYQGKLGLAEADSASTETLVACPGCGNPLAMREGTTKQCPVCGYNATFTISRDVL